MLRPLRSLVLAAFALIALSGCVTGYGHYYDEYGEEVGYEDDYGDGYGHGGSYYAGPAGDYGPFGPHRYDPWYDGWSIGLGYGYRHWDGYFGFHRYGWPYNRYGYGYYGFPFYSDPYRYGWPYWSYRPHRPPGHRPPPVVQTAPIERNGSRPLLRPRPAPSPGPFGAQSQGPVEQRSAAPRIRPRPAPTPQPIIVPQEVSGSAPRMRPRPMPQPRPVQSGSVEASGGMPMQRPRPAPAPAPRPAPRVREYDAAPSAPRIAPPRQIEPREREGGREPG